MAKVIVSTEVCGMALGAIGFFPTTESAPDPEQLRRAMTFLDLLLGELVGTELVFSRLTTMLDFPITNGTQSYDLYAVLDDDVPADGIQFVTGAWLQDSAGNRSPIEIVPLRKFEDVCRPGMNGTPCYVHIDRIEDDAQVSPKLRIYPTPASTDTTVWTLKLEAQRFSPNLAPAGVSGARRESTTIHRMGQAWQRWMIFQLAHDLGTGPIVKLPESSLARFAAVAADAKARLLAFNDREHETTPPICEPWGNTYA